MADQQELSRAFEEHRSHLIRVAYGTLGSVAGAEDVVQEAWLRLARQEDPEEILDLRAWLTRVTARLALDQLDRAHVRKERYVGSWLPEPLVDDAAPDPVDTVTLDESVSMALMVVLESLSPAERTAFVLHDVFGHTFEEVGEVVGRSPAAVRQLASRARKHVDQGRPRFPASREEQTEIVGAFAAAVSGGDLEQLIGVLDPDVVWTSDGGGHVPAVRDPLHGAERVAQVLLGFAKRPFRGGRLAMINGAPGLVMSDPDGVLTVMSFTLDAGQIVAIDTIRNPEKLTHVEAP